MKRTLTFALTLLLALSLLVPTFASAEAGKDYLSIMTEPGTFPIVTEPVQLHVWISPPSWIGDLNENWFTKYFEELTGIDFVFTRNNMEDHWDKMNLTLASQVDMPDLFLSWGVNNAQQMLYGSQGVFVPLNDMIEKYGVYTKKVFEYSDVIEKSATAPDGNIYGLPAINECYHCSMPFKAWVDQTWLTNLGLEMPKTTDDFYNMLKAFKEQDANGNGDPNDEIPMTKATWSADLDIWLMNAFCYNAGGSRWYLENDVISGNANTDAFREGLKFINKLYAEGLIDPEYMISDNDKVKLLTGAEGGNRAGVVAGGAIQFVDTALPVKENFVAIPPLTGPEGVSFCAQDPLGMGQGNAVITSKCKYPEIAFRVADAIYQLYLTDDYNLFGPEGEVWIPAGEGQKGLDGKPAKYQILKSGQEPNNFTWSEGLNTFLSASFRNGMAATDNWDAKHEEILFNETANKYEGHGPKQIMPNLFYLQEEQEQLSDLAGVADKYIAESMTSFITGTLDINSDNDWNAYVKELEKMGYAKMRDIVQGAYDRLLK